MVRRGASAFLLALAVIAVGAPAAAAPDEPPPSNGNGADPAGDAKQQYQLGTQAFAAKRYSEAALHFEAAAALKASAIALYTAALAWDLASRPERAADAYARSLDVPGLDAKQTSVAKDRVAQMEKSLGTLQVTAPDGWKVQLDALTEVPAPARLHASAGAHQLSVRAPGKAIEKRDVTLEAGKTTPLELKDDTKPAKPEEPHGPEKPVGTTPAVEPLPPRLAHPFWTTAKVAGVGVAGVGVAGLIAAAILGTNAEDARDAYNSAPTRPGYDHASSLQTWTNISLIAGAVFVAGGIALVVIPSGDRSDVRVRAAATPGGVVVGGTF